MRIFLLTLIFITLVGCSLERKKAGKYDHLAIDIEADCGDQKVKVKSGHDRDKSNEDDSAEASAP